MTDLKKELLAIKIEDDILKEMQFLHGASQANNSYLNMRDGVGMVFSFWRERHPDLLLEIASDAERMLEIWRQVDHGCGFGNRKPCPIDAEYLCVSPTIACDGIDALLRTRPVISRSLCRLEFGQTPFAQRGGIEFSQTGWLPIIEDAFDWLEAEAVARKEAGFPNSHLPLLNQVKEKFGGLTISASVPASLWPAWRKRMEAISERSERTCMSCGAPGEFRGNGWAHTYCDACEAAYQAERGQQ